MSEPATSEKNYMADPVFRAQWDYKEGGGQCDNPYQEGDLRRQDYAWEMHRLQHRELAEMGLGVHV